MIKALNESGISPQCEFYTEITKRIGSEDLSVPDIFQEYCMPLLARGGCELWSRSLCKLPKTSGYGVKATHAPLEV